MRFQEYDTFVPSKPLESKDVPVGSVGTVLMILDSENPTYEVEFCDEEDLSVGKSMSHTLTEEYMGESPF